jgi:hypothetical protein
VPPVIPTGSGLSQRLSGLQVFAQSGPAKLCKDTLPLKQRLRSAQVLLNPTFDDSSIWTLGAGVSIGSGVATAAGAGQVLGQAALTVGLTYLVHVDWTATGGVNLRLNNSQTNGANIVNLWPVGAGGTQIITFGKTYDISLDWNSSTGVNLRLAAAVAASIYGAPWAAAGGTSGTKTMTIVATTPWLWLEADGGLFTGTIDNFTATEVAAVPTAYSLTADVATFTFSPQSAQLEQGYSMAASAAAFAFSPQAAQLEHGYNMAAAVSSYSFSPQAANLLRGYNLAAGVSTYAFSPQAANLGRGFQMAAAVMTISFSPQAIGVLMGYALGANAAIFSFAPQAMTTALHVSLQAQVASYSFNPQPYRISLGYDILPPSSGGGSGVKVVAVLL